MARLASVAARHLIASAGQAMRDQVGDRIEDGDLRAELVTLRSRVEEQTALTKRTADALRRLAESLSARKRRYERLMSLNSFAAYALFTVLLGGGFYLLYHSRVGELVEAKREAVSARDQARARADGLQSELDARLAAADRAGAFFELVQANEATRIVAAYPELDHDSLTPTERELFAQAAHAARAEVAGDRGDIGLKAYESGDYAEAAAELARALEVDGETARAATMRYYLGRARHQLGEHEAASRALELALAGRVEATGLTDARYHLGAALEALGDPDRAIAAYERFAEEYPSADQAAEASQRAAALRDGPAE